MDLAYFQVTVACFAVFDFTERRLVFAGITVMVTVFDAAAYRVPAATVMVTLALPGLTGITFVPEIFTTFVLEDFRETFPSDSMLVIMFAFFLLFVSVMSEALITAGTGVIAVSLFASLLELLF